MPSCSTAGVENGFHRLPDLGRLARVGQGRMQDQTVNVPGLQVAQGHLERLRDLLRGRRFRVVRDPLRVVARQRRELGLQIQLGAA